MVRTPAQSRAAGYAPAVALVCAALLLAAPARAQQALSAGGARPARPGAARPVIPRLAVAAPRTAPVELDGRLTEAAWQSAIAIGDFTQTQPNQGQPATQRTEVRFLVDGDALFVGARMYDSLGAAGVRNSSPPPLSSSSRPATGPRQPSI